MKPKILVIIPVYNCENYIGRMLNNIENQLKKYIDTVLIINNQSSDNTEKVAMETLKRLDGINGVLLTNITNYGYGGSLKIGFEYMLKYKFDWAIVINGDDQSPLSDFLPILSSKDYIKYDIMWGSRFHPKATLRNYSKARIVANYVFNLLFSVAMKQRISDIGCGVYMYSRKVLKQRMYKNMPDVLYIGSYLRLAHDYYGHCLKEFPINWNNDDQDSTVKIFTQTLANFKLALRYLFNKKRFVNAEHNLSKNAKYQSNRVFTRSLEGIMSDENELITLRME